MVGALRRNSEGGVQGRLRWGQSEWFKAVHLTRVAKEQVWLVGFLKFTVC